MNIFSRTKNLYNIQRTYGLIRDFIEKPELRRDRKFQEKLLKSLLAVQEFREMLEFLKGKKTYIIAALTLVVQGLYMAGTIDESMRDNLLVLLGGGAVATVSAKINRIQKNIAPILIIALLSYPATATAQIQFPITVQVVWDVSPASDQVTKFTVIHNGNSTETVPGVACTATECARPITLLNEGPHIVAITATNQWGTSEPSQVTFTARSPGKSGNVRIRMN